MSSSDDTLIDNMKKKKMETVELSILGNWKLFLQNLGTSLGKFLIVISIGSIITSLASKANDQPLLDKIFPIDQEKDPYCWSGGCNNDAMFPFNLPYQHLKMRAKYPENRMSWVIDWYEYMFMKSFITSRVLLQSLYKNFAYMNKKVSDLIVFYVVSYLVFLIMFDSSIRGGFTVLFMFLGFILFFVSSFDRNDDQRYIWTLFPLTYAATFLTEALEALVTGDFISLFVRVVACILCVTLGFGITFLNMSWILLLSYIVFVYVLFVVPFTILYHVGISDCLNMIKSHGRSICAIVTVMIIYTSYNTLDLNVALGTLIVGLFLLFKLLRDQTMFDSTVSQQSS